MKKIIFISLLFLSAFNLNAQQQFLFNNFLMNDYYYNPAVAGSKDVHYANLGFRSQWAGFNEAPVSMYANFYGSYKNQMKHGYGASIVNDRSGLVSNTGFLLNYAYHVRLGDNLKLGLGVKPGFVQYRIKLYDAQVADAGDDVLTGTTLSAGAFDLSSGIHLYTKRFFFMASMRHMLGQKITFTDFNDGLSKHYTGIVGYNWLVKKKSQTKETSDGEKTETSGETPGQGEDGKPAVKKKKDLEIMPAVMVKYVRPIEPQISGMIKFTYDHKMWLGLTVRSQDAVGVNLGFTIKKRLQIGYGFDYSLGQVKSYNYGSHEIMLTFQTTSKKPSLDEQDEELNNSIFEDNKSDKKDKK
ncbi:MAG: type IX secretion system membrane protein PorP/SprF [Crocinitomicaceae bacterium]|nr:type IX secretion system membrane protein PorP/SprF [Crocinitomicaceae bacterium]